MASSSTLANRISCHTRSISLPSRPHPQITSLEDQLSRLRSSTTASTSSSSSSVCQNLGLLNDLYQSFDDFLQLQHSHEQYCPQQVEKSLDGSVKLLDICSMTKEALLITKEGLQNLESSLRRRRSGCESSVVLQKFQDSRKNAKRIVSRCSKNLSKMEIQSEKNSHFLEEVEAVSLPILQSILSFVYGSEATKSSTLLSKLMIMPSKQARKQGEVMEKMDQAFEVLKGQKKNTEETIELQSVELIIQELEEGLDCLFRRLLKSRVSLLNLLNR